MGDLFGGINIDFVEPDGRDLLGEFFEDGADHSAWATPGCPKIEDDDLVTVDLTTNRPKERRLGVGLRSAMVTRWTHKFLELSKRADWLDDILGLGAGWLDGFHDDSEGKWESI